MEIADGIKRTKEEKYRDNEQNNLSQRIKDKPGRADRHILSHEQDDSHRHMHNTRQGQKPGA
jgi:hypothetical protein